MRVGDEAVSGLTQRARKIGPGDQSTIREDGVRHVTSCGPNQSCKEHREDDHPEQRLKDSPGSPERGLLVPDLDVPPRQEPQQFPVLPDLCGPPAHYSHVVAAGGVGQDNLLIRPPATCLIALPATVAAFRLARAISSISPHALASRNLIERYNQ